MTNKEKAAAENYNRLANDFDDWVELKWADYNDELKMAFLAGIKWQKNTLKPKGKSQIIHNGGL